ncbi:uncharacterized protein LOC120344912 isoform X2 [Styela clava]
MGSGASKGRFESSMRHTDDELFNSQNSNNHNPQKYTSTDQTNPNASLASSLPGIVISAKKLAHIKRKEKDERRQKILWQYPELADALHSAQEWIQEMSKAKDDDLMRKKMNMNTRQKFDELYVLYFDCEEAEHKKILGDQLSNDNAGQICADYLKTLTEDGKNTPTEGYDSECLYTVRSFCWNYSDASLEFATVLGRMGSFSIFIADLKTFRDKLNDEGIRENIILPSISILHNCAKASDNKKYFKILDSVEAIFPYTTIDNQEIKMIAMMTLSYIIEEKDNDKISADGTVISLILSYLRNSIKSIDHKYEGFTAYEIASGIMHLASNDQNKLKIVNQGVLPLLVKLLYKGSDSEKAISAKTVWVLAFREENKSKIREEENMMKLLKELAEQKGEARESASGALWVLGDDERVEKIRSSLNSMVITSSSSISSSFKFKKKQKLAGKSKLKRINESERSQYKKSDKQGYKYNEELKEEEEAENNMSEISEDEQDDEEAVPGHPQEKSQISEESPRRPGHVMISYQWSCQKLMLRVKDRLERMSYKVWIDVESMGGSTLQAMAEAVEKSEVVLVCMSQKYKESPNCRTEAEYAYKLGKTLVPVKVESGYEADGWLGALQGAKFYLDFSNLNAFESMFSKLLKELGNKGKADEETDGPITRASARLVHAIPPKLAPRIPVNQWSKEDVIEWATKNQIQSRKIQNLDGESLMFLGSLKSSAPEFFYKYISERFGLIELRDLMSISRGLEDLEA